MNNIAINGFGRIGRAILRQALEKDYEITAINDPRAIDPAYMAYMFKLDSTHGRFPGKVVHDAKHLIINGLKIRLFNETDPKQVPWYKVFGNYVIEASGRFTSLEQAKGFLEGGAKKVIICALSEDAPMYLCGINLNKYDPKHKIVSMGTCTTNCLGPIAKVLNDKFGIKEALVTAIHAVTPSQPIIDGTTGTTYRDTRGGIQNIIPTFTKSLTAVTNVMPSLKGRITGIQFRVPTPDVSVLDLSVHLRKSATYNQIKYELRVAAEEKLRGILGYTEEQVVSSDLLGSTCSSIFDASSGLALNSNTFKLLSWYDNEVGYSARVLDLIAYMNEMDEKDNVDAEKNQTLKKF